MVLLDTHTLLWAFGDDENLSEEAKRALTSNKRCISIASLWEIAIKQSLADERRRLILDTSILEIADECHRQDIEILSITPYDCQCVTTLPHIHEDPFDRLIISQALTRGIAIVTKDTRIWEYEGIRKIW